MDILTQMKADAYDKIITANATKAESDRIAQIANEQFAEVNELNAEIAAEVARRSKPA